MQILWQYGGLDLGSMEWSQGSARKLCVCLSAISVGGAHGQWAGRAGVGAAVHILDILGCETWQAS